MDTTIVRKNGTVEWTHNVGDTYLVTGVDRNGKRFRVSTPNWVHASGINVFRGSKWLVRDGRKVRLVSVFN